MATFIEEAQALLSAEKFNRLEMLRMKSNSFETNQDEEKEFSDLKNEVRKAIAQRDKDKNLAFIADPSIELIDILRVKKVTREEINKAIKVLFPVVPMATEIVANIPYKNKAGKEAIAGVKFGTGDEVRIDRQASNEIKKIGVKGFVKNLTDFGKTWIIESHVAEGGPKSGETVFDNLPKVALRFKFNIADLKKELGIK